MNLKRTLTTIQKIMTADASKKEPVTATIGDGYLTVARPGRMIKVTDPAWCTGGNYMAVTVLLGDLIPVVKSNPTTVRATHNGDISCQIETDTGLDVTCNIFDSEARGLLDTQAAQNTATIPRDTIFSPMIAKIVHSCAGSFDAYRLEVADKRAEVIATDSVRLIVVSGPAKGKIAINLPGWTALVSGLIATSPVQVTEQGFGFELANEDRSIVVTGLTDGKSFPNYRHIMPKSGDALSATFKPGALAKTVELLMPFAGDAGNAKIKKITVDVPEGRTYRQMEIKAPGTKDAHAVGCFASGFLKKPIMFNPKYIAEFLATIKREAVAKWQLWDASRPALFSAKSDDAEFRYLLMPINL